MTTTFNLIPGKYYIFDNDKFNEGLFELKYPLPLESKSQARQIIEQNNIKYFTVQQWK